MDAGLCGFSIQRLGKHSAQADFDGSPMVTDTMCDEDILNLARVLARARRGFHRDHAGDRPYQGRPRVRREARRRPRSGRFCSRRSPRVRSNPDIHRKSLNWLHKARAKGLPIFGQAGTVRSGFAFTLEHWNLYDMAPAWRDMTTGTKEEKIAKMKDPAIREAVKSERSMCSARQERAGHRRPAGEADRAMGREQARTRKVRRQIARPNRPGRRASIRSM